MGSASLISDYKGDEYQRIEYTPYGETWVEKTSNTGLEFLPYKFTAKELDKETGFYYYGARYLDPKYSRWISTDPALGEYIPDIGKGTAENFSGLPGMGGVYNTVNASLYHYAGNNPVKYTDPDGNDIQAIYLGGAGAKLIVGGDVSVGIAWDDNGNYALAVTGSVGVGMEAGVNLPFTPAGSISTGTNLNDLKGIGAFKVDGDASIYGLETNVSVVFGINVDNENSEVTGWNVGIVGGGVTFASGTLYVMLKHGIGDLVEKYNKLDSASQKEFMQGIQESKQMPSEIKEQILSTIEEPN